MSPLGKLSLLLGLTTLAILLILPVGRSTQLVRAATPVYADAASSCATLTPCFTTIQEAVNNAGPAPAEVFVFPGTYAESVDLSLMGSDIAGSAGDLTLTTVNASGTPAPSTVTVSPAAGQAFQAGCTFPGSITIDGFTVLSLDTDGIDLCTDGDITIKNVTANGNDSDGIRVDADPGNVTITNVTANGNSGGGVNANAFEGNLTVSGSTANDNVGSEGFDLEADGTITVTGSTANGNLDAEGFELDNDGTVTVTDSHASGNFDEGFDIDATTGDVTVNDSTANDNGDDGFDIDAGSATITNSTANGNDDEGFQSFVSGDTLYDRVTAIGNLGDGVDPEGAFIDEGGPSAGNVTIRNSNIQENDSGVEMLESGTTAGTLLVNGNIICGNTTSGLASLSDVSVNSEGNWWGAASGPTHPSNAAGTGDAVLDAANPGDLFAEGAVDFTPWIDTVSGSGTAIVGQASTISFEFKGGAGAVAFAEGPGDTTGAPTFTSATSNGTASTSGFVSGGKLNVSLTASTVGTANVTVTGPCGITGSFAVAVAAAPVAPTPTVVQLPPTGSGPSEGASGLPWLVLAAAVIAITSGGLALAYRTRRTR